MSPPLTMEKMRMKLMARLELGSCVSSSACVTMRHM